jgi:hypothetical protein
MDLYVASLALVVLSQVSSPAPPNDLNRAESILTSYEDAYNRAGQEGKPILVLFTSQSQPSELQAMKSLGLLDNHLVVVADKNTDAGRRVFANFNWQAPEGVSVVDRTRQWQFARYERKLSGEELTRVVNATRDAAGYPTVDVLATNVSAYPPPAQGQAAQPQGGAVTVQGQPGVPYAQPTMQFQPMMYPPMGFGGGCAGGSCGGGFGGFSGGGCAGGRCR